MEPLAEGGDVGGVLSTCECGCCCCSCRACGTGERGGESDNKAVDDVVVVSVDELLGDSATLGAGSRAA